MGYPVFYKGEPESTNLILVEFELNLFSIVGVFYVSYKYGIYTV